MPTSEPAPHLELRRRARERRWWPAEDRLQLLAELCLLSQEERSSTRFLERAAVAIALQSQGGCVIALRTGDGHALEPVAIHDADPEACAVLAQLAGRRFALISGLEDEMVRGGPGRRVPIGPEILAQRPALRTYMEMTGRRCSAVVPLRTGDETIGVLWTASDDDRDDHVHFLDGVASRLALTIDRARLAEQLQASGRRSGRDPAAALTSREREILALVAEGMTNREAAAELVLSVRTVEWHRARIEAKLGVSGRAALTRVARASGLLTAPLAA